MSLLETIVGAERAPEQQGVLDGGDTSSPLAAFFAARTEAGATVTVERALGLDAVWRALWIWNASVGVLPLITYEDRGDDENPDRRRAVGEHVYQLLRRKPNAEMTARFWKGLLAMHLMAHGDIFLGKQFNGSRLSDLWPIVPDRVDVERKGGRKLYWVKDRRGYRERDPYTSAQVIHIPGFSLDGLRGLSAIGMAREGLGAGLAMDAYSNGFFARSAVPQFVLSSDLEVDEASAKRAMRRWNRLLRGFRNSYRTVVLEKGLKPVALNLPAKDMEFVQQQNLSVKKVARWFAMPASRLDAEIGQGLTYRNVTEDDVAFLKHSVTPVLMLIEEGLWFDDDLFPPKRTGGVLFPEFLTAGVERGAMKERYESYRIATGGRAWMHPSQVAKIENQEYDERLDEQAAGEVPEPAPEEDDPDLRAAKLAGEVGLAAQRLGLGMKYGVMSDEEARARLGMTGPGPGPTDEPDDPFPVE